MSKRKIPLLVAAMAPMLALAVMSAAPASADEVAHSGWHPAPNIGSGINCDGQSSFKVSAGGFNDGAICYRQYKVPFGFAKTFTTGLSTACVELTTNQKVAVPPRTTISLLAPHSGTAYVLGTQVEPICGPWG